MTDIPSPSTSELVHASCVALSNDAILIMGPSGSGKSDLSLRLIDRGAALVSDDYTLLEVRDGEEGLIASPPETIAGKMEVRGLGILALPWRDHARVRLIITLRSGDDPPLERLPLTRELQTLCGQEIPVVRLSAFEASAPIKAEYALHACAGSPCLTEGGSSA